MLPSMRVVRRVSHEQQEYNMSWMLCQAKVCVQELNVTRAKHLFRALQAERGFAPRSSKPQ